MCLIVVANPVTWSAEQEKLRGKSRKASKETKKTNKKAKQNG